MTMDMKQPTSGFVGLARLGWAALGPAFLALTTSHIFLEGTGWHTPADYVFFSILAAIILGRGFEVLRGIPLVTFGEPATGKDFYGYAASVLVAGLAIWAFANAFGNGGAA
jgi:hypothetical protein